MVAMSDTPSETSGPHQSAWRRLISALGSSTSYGIVLLLILVSYAISVSLSSDRSGSLVLAVQMVTVWFALRTSHSRRGLRTVAMVLLVCSGIVAVLNLLSPDLAAGNGLVALTAGVLYLIAPLSIIRHLVTRRVIDVETLAGALAAYLLWGMCYAFFYHALGLIQDASFFGTSGDGSFPQDLFFSFTTLTTTGYGNLVPAGNPGQTLAVSEMLLGQLFLVTAIGKIVSAWRPARVVSAAGAGDDEAAGS
jgi:Ion channel